MVMVMMMMMMMVSFRDHSHRQGIQIFKKNRNDVYTSGAAKTQNHTQTVKRYLLSCVKCFFSGHNTDYWHCYPRTVTSYIFIRLAFRRIAIRWIMMMMIS